MSKKDTIKDKFYLYSECFNPDNLEKDTKKEFHKNNIKYKTEENNGYNTFYEFEDDLKTLEKFLITDHDSKFDIDNIPWKVSVC